MHRAFAAVRSVLLRLRRLFVRERFELELDDEMAFHFEMALARRVASGIDPNIAREQTLKEFGSMARYKDEVRDARGITVFDDLWRDVRFGARALARARGFTLATIATVALGIGAGTAIFALVNALLLRPLPYPDADRLVGMWHTMPGLGIKLAKQAPGTYALYQKTAKSFDEVGICVSLAATLTYPSTTLDPERVRAGYMTQSMFSILRARPILGRTFTDSDASKAATPVVVISQRLWQSRFGSRPDVLGRIINVDGAPRTVIGVMPASFAFPEAQTPIWIPTGDDPPSTVGSFGWDGFGRLKPGVSLAMAQHELDNLLPRLPEMFPELQPGVTTVSAMRQTKLAPVLHSMRDDVIAGFDHVLWLIAAAVGLVVVVAMSNVASLVLVRTEARRRELAVRTALGAGTTSIWKALAIENVMIAALGLVLGLAGAAAAVNTVVAARPAGLPRANEIHIDVAVVSVAVVLATIFAVVSTVLAALRVRPAEAMRVLREGGRGGTSGRGAQRLRTAFVAIEVALSVVLLGGATILGRSTMKLRAVDPGFDPSNVLTFWTFVPPSTYRQSSDVARFFDDALARVRQIPGVTSAAASGKLPLEIEGYPYKRLIYVDGEQTAGVDLPPVYQISSTTADYFATMRIPVLFGRVYDDANVRRGAFEAVVSRGFAEAHWHDATGQGAIGQRVRLDNDGPWFTIVGVSGDVRDSTLVESPIAEVYFPETQVPDTMRRGITTMRNMGFVIRTRGPMPDLMQRVQHELHALDPTLPFYRPAWMSDIVADARAQMTFALALLGAGAVVTLFLGAIGLYGVIAYVVSLRSREISIRIALGLAPAGASQLILRQGRTIIVLGTAIGLGVFLVFARLLTSLTFEVSAFDTTALLATIVAVTGVALLATWVPARRAARIDPAEALKAD
ncbi:MAG TPA: ABC transporter permease [Gemmatimonadaceae bacterium]|jgi:predicted permease